MGIAIGAKHASVVWRVSVSRRVRYGRFHCISFSVVVRRWQNCAIQSVPIYQVSTTIGANSVSNDCIE